MGLGWHPIYEMEKNTCLKPPTSDCQSFKCTLVRKFSVGILDQFVATDLSVNIMPHLTNVNQWHTWNSRLSTPALDTTQFRNHARADTSVMTDTVPYFRTPMCDVEVSQTLESTAAAEKLVTCLCKMQNLERLPHHLVPGSWHFLGVYICTWSPCLLATGDHECKRAIITALHLLWNVHSIVFVLWFFWYPAVNKPNNPNTHSNIFTLIPSPIHIQHPPKCFQTYAFIPYIRGSLIFLWGIWWF